MGARWVDDEPPDDCMRCGACCFSESPRHARVTGDDHGRLGDDAERFVEWIGNEAFMRIERVTGDMHKCIALASMRHRRRSRAPSTIATSGVP